MDGRKIREMRKKAGLTQTDLAERLNVAQSIISRWEQGRDEVPRPRRAEIAEVLGVTIAELGADEQAAEDARSWREDGYIRTSGEVNAWRDKLGVSSMNPYLRLILSILPSFRHGEIVLVTRQQLIDDANLPGELVDEHWPAVLASEWVERVGEVEWAFRLVMPEG